MDVSYKLLSKSDTIKLFKILSGILPSIYAFNVALSKNPTEVMNESQMLFNEQKASISTSNTDIMDGSLNSSMNANLVENSELKNAEDSEGFEAGRHKVDYYEAALLFHSLPELKEVCINLLADLEEFESGGIHLLSIFIDTSIQMDYTLFQSFILNFFLWGSHPICEYFQGKEEINYTNNVSRSVVLVYLYSGMDDENHRHYQGGEKMS